METSNSPMLASFISPLMPSLRSCGLSVPKNAGKKLFSISAGPYAPHRLISHKCTRLPTPTRPPANGEPFLIRSFQVTGSSDFMILFVL